jgi:flagellar biosynthetic protein FlhB
MAEHDEQERELPASPRRLEQAREEGRVARSRELGTCLLLLGASGALALGGPHFAAALARLFAGALQFDRAAAFSEPRALERLGAYSVQALELTAPFFALLAVAGIAGSLAVGGWVLSSRAFAFDAARLNPLRGLANMVSGASLAELVKAIAKAALVAVAGALILSAARPDLSAMAFAAPEAAAGRAGSVLVWAFALLAACFALVAAADVPHMLWRHARSLRMSREELRREARETEGDPQVRARVRSLQRDAARRRMMSEVPRAEVVVTNPTHYAVALAYRAGMRAPRVLAKGSGLVAARIRALAEEHAVPLLEAPALARALFRHAELGGEIPAGLYDAAAQVLAWVFQLRRARAAGACEPARPDAIAVPPELGVVEESA